MSLRHRLGYFLTQLDRSRAQRELAEEMRTHLEMDIEENVRRGMSPEKARIEAERTFGNVLKAREASSDSAGFGSFDAWTQDVKTGVRVLSRSPGFAAAALVSLTLGIGANTAIYSLLDVVLLLKLPVDAPEELVIVGDPTAYGRRVSGDWSGLVHPYPVYEKFRDRNEVFSGVLASGAIGGLDVGVGEGGENHRRARTRAVTGNYFELLGVGAAMGRAFGPDDDVTPGGHPFVVVSYGFWERALGRDPGVVGRSLRANGVELTIVGVAEKGFYGVVTGYPADLWVPMMMQAELMPGRNWLASSENSWLHIIGRLSPNVTLEQASAQLNLLFAGMLREDINGSMTEHAARQILERGLPLVPGGAGLTSMRHFYGEQLFVLMGVVGLVLLIACANLANMLLSRAPARRREIALRMALGASRTRLLRQLLVETLLLSGTGGVLALISTSWATTLLARALSSTISLTDLTPSPRVFAFGFALSVFTGIAFGLLPALRATRVELIPALKASADRSVYEGRQAFGAGKVMVVSQVAVSLLLLVVSGLFARTLQNLHARPLGYDRENMFVVLTDPIGGGYEGEDITRLCRRILEGLESIPGVTGVTMSENGLFSVTESEYDVAVEGFTPESADDASVFFDQVGPNYFTNVGIPLLEGRDFESGDDEAAPRVAVINETMARFYFGDESPLGKRLTTLAEDPLSWSAEIVGVAADARDHDLRQETPRRFYLPYYQRVFETTVANFEVRAPTSLPGMAEQIRDVVRAVDPDLPLRDVASLEVLIARRLRSERQMAQISSLLSLLALLLVSIGLYGVMSYAVARRTNEIGIRMALGAGRNDVTWMVLKETMVLVALGTTMGIPLALTASRLAESRFFGVTPADPATAAVAIAILVSITAVAGYLPARRAAGIDPILALRHD